ncbi:uncharacterized protein LOC113274896 [Papaver somniferum]|uniref:uncharacterized protein LOC113274896 n=1 Tax=Papaver somniferum TaxID=3469 RepID=UPI000E705C76|nr:uncharacterized protein LOC113274896 [Papaver somniferum]XP_026380100.1 uncharacterized protein LOC113274896 [Papaver somniferum]
MEESVASTTRDFSELSVSINPPPSRRLEPIDFSRLRWGSIGFTLRRKDPNFDGCVDGNAARYEHVILFEGRLGSTFTVDDGPERDANDPINAEFLEFFLLNSLSEASPSCCVVSIKNFRIPEEFEEVGLHTFLVQRTCKAFEEAAGKFVPKKHCEESIKYMWF